MVADFADKHILVTGASADSDIGLAICQTLAGRGARLCLVGRRPDMLEQTRQSLAEPGRHHIAPFDLTGMDRIPDWMRDLAKQHGPLHGLVHSASYQGYSILRQVDQAQFDRYFAINVGAAAMLARGFHRKGVYAEGGGSIVLIGSVAGLQGQKGRSLYASSKAALTSLAQSLALELADRRIRVNVVAPAVVLGRKAEQQFAMLPPEQRAALDAAHPLGYGQPADVAAASAFLLSGEARWITGVTLPVDGGYTAG